MTLYKSNLLDHLEGLSDTIKWIVIIAATLAAAAVVLVGVRGAHETVRLAHADETPEPVEQPVQPTPEPAAQEPVVTPAPAQQAQSRPAPRRQQPKPAQPEDTTRYLSEFEGYVINGIMLLEGAPPEVLLKKSGDIRSYRVGDTVEGFTVESIHRHHIILVRGKDRVHLNRVQF